MRRHRLIRDQNAEYDYSLFSLIQEREIGCKVRMDGELTVRQRRTPSDSLRNPSETQKLRFLKQDTRHNTIDDWVTLLTCVVLL